MNRPFFSKSIHELTELYAGGSADPATLHHLKAELAQRKSRAAAALFARLVAGVESNQEPQTVVTGAVSKRVPQTATSSSRRSAKSAPLTNEQQQAIERFSTKETVKIRAFAGSGKTSTLIAMARNDTRPGMYVAFNKSIADEAKSRFPGNVQCQTVHSLAYRAMAPEYKNSGKMTGSLNSNAVESLLSLAPLRVGEIELSSKSLAGLVCGAIRRFCYSEDEQFNDTHVPHWGRLAVLQGKDRALLAAEVLSKTRILWKRMFEPNDSVPLGHDGYLKLWALSNPKIERDYLLLDEAQDTNPVVIGVLRKLQLQQVYVGDPHQQIYEWRGAKNAMEELPAKHEIALTMSFRFGDRIADVANCILSRIGERTKIRGNPEVRSYVGGSRFDAVVSRTNASLISVLIAQLRQNKKVCIVGGTQEPLRLLDGVERLQANRPTDVPEFFGFANWAEVLAYSTSDEGQELRTFVRMIEQFGVARLRGALSSVVSAEQSADVVLTTAHKSKGREWSNTVLTDDFLPSKKSETGELKEPALEEFRIAYVATTRAKATVILPPEIAIRFRIAQSPPYPPADLRGDTGEPAPYAYRNTTVESFLETAETKPSYGKTGFFAKLRDLFN